MELHPEDDTVLPPLPLPDLPGVTFLASVGEIQQEGLQMGHCIASYAPLASRGGCYLFHIDYQGQTASVEVDQHSRVVQAYGPRNQDKLAARWGRKVLSDWGSQFSSDTYLRIGEEWQAGYEGILF